ncbi:hypothetical protein P152DRAFT_467720 [Eremomyces bilateralis CBS 781.70]|uniref:EF-hand domain-containing protein n=1 Tax=Eremomyces bilateralis CBS 781.70 TaxID=1392243 RepID=A0A6G1FY20_9PEZI|nr:uncharacterized protein P152DRAFT_467720 [Eremomyces bilateralis CBS 781.70]KAF1810693.1 hypothetical protein P152DRAFT_467720 [Eremomyces bilateralis CBS 781.70]
MSTPSNQRLDPINTNPSPTRGRSASYLTVHTADPREFSRMPSMKSPSQVRDYATRLDDDLALLQVERQVSQDEKAQAELGRGKSMNRSRSKREEPMDEFDVSTNPVHQGNVFRPPENPSTNFAKVFKKIHGSNFLVRYVTYITPIVLIILIPLLLGVFVFEEATVGGVRLMWFCIWLEIVWLTLWAGRILAKGLPYPIGMISSLFTNNAKKWRDMGQELEFSATLFFWWLAVEISFLPTMANHHIDGNKTVRDWERTMNKVLVAIFVGMILNFVEKIIIQLIAISFHLRTYQDRIELNHFQIGSLTKLYEYSRGKIEAEDSEFEERSSGPATGARTPGVFVEKAQKGAKEVLNKVGDVAGKIAGDFSGKKVISSDHPQQVILTLLHTTSGSQVLARRLYRTFVHDGCETICADEIKHAFDIEEEAEAAFAMFDKDMNGDISMEELEAVCVEIGRERKSIMASLKDLDSVVSKLDSVFLFIVLVITILVFVSLISTSAAGVLTSAGSAVLALSWLFSATAQEFLQSIIFVFVKHPFDVGDRVRVYGNTGAEGQGDDYFVKKISLLYTEFKKMEGMVVQAPNSYLNTLFILNQRRSGGQAEAVPIVIKFGTTLEQIENLRTRLLDFVQEEKREYQGKILTELREVSEAHSLKLNVVFFYKSNWQNELLRLQRRNKFICALMVSMQELCIEGPRMRYPGQKESFPMYMQHIPHVPNPNLGQGGTPDNPSGFREQVPQDEPFVPEPSNPPDRSTSKASRASSQAPDYSRTRTRRGESLSEMSKRYDFSLGMKDVSSGDWTGDVFEERQPIKIPVNVTSASPSRPSGSGDEMGRRRSHDVGSVGRSTSLRRIPTESSEMRARPSHRNRFFGRRGRDGEEVELMEAGMADIPEAVERERMDPRTGYVGAGAIRTTPCTDPRLI